MSESDQAFCLIGLIVCLGACLIWATFEIESWRQRQRWRQEVVHDAMRTVVMIMDDKDQSAGH